MRAWQLMSKLIWLYRFLPPSSKVH